MLSLPTRRSGDDQKSRRKSLRRLVEFQGIRRLSVEQYRKHIRKIYDGPAGAMLALGSWVSLHEPLVGQILRKREFDVTGCRRILDVGSGAGQILQHLIKATGTDTQLVAFDLSHTMLKRARGRISRATPHYVVGDMTELPFADGSFDCVTCGWVIEHLPDPRPGLREIARVLRPGGRLLLAATEDTLPGVITSHTWDCRTYNRQELREVSAEVGLPWQRELWFTPLHRLLRMGGILVEAQRAEISGAISTPPTAHSSGQEHAGNRAYRG